MLRGQSVLRALIGRCELVAAILVLTGYGCASTLRAVDLPSVHKSFEYLEIGKITKEEVLRRLGEPSAQFESGRILTYRLRLGDDLLLVVAGREADPADSRFSQWKGANHSLVLVFDQSNILARFVVLRVK